MFIYSVIMPLYNAERYLSEAIDSIVNQTIGFEENIQLILVNDGSSDATEEICRRYQTLFPDNVELINKKNGGVSSARNEGIRHIKGELTLFFDGDDIWDKKALEVVYQFFRANPDAFDVCCCRLKFIGEYKGLSHPLDYRFDEGTRIVDLIKSPEIISSTIGNIVIKSRSIEDILFDEDLITGEDATFVNSILLKRPVLGVLATAVFYYRRDFKKATGSSSAPSKKAWFLDVPKNYYMELCNKSIDRYGHVLPFIQNIILYDLTWRKYDVIQEVLLTEDERNTYKSIIKEVLQQLDDEIIASFRGASQYKKLGFLNLKHETNIAEKCTFQKHKLAFEGNNVFNIKAPSVFKINAIDVKHCLIIEGTFKAFLPNEKATIHVVNSKGESSQVALQRYPQEDELDLHGNIVAKGFSFHVELPLLIKEKYGFTLHIGKDSILLKPSFSVDEPLSRYIKSSYTIKNGYLIKYIKNRICLYKDTFKTRTISKFRRNKEIKEKISNPNVNKLKKRIDLYERTRSGLLKSRVFFFSPRLNDVLSSNLEGLYDTCTSSKSFASKMSPLSEMAHKEISNEMYHSKVVVTDDYNLFFRRYGKRKGQSFVQIWHASGAFKKFGLDGTSNLPLIDRRYHENYDLVCVSSESIREIYAKAFDIPTERVKALGIPRTDIFYDPSYRETVRESIFDKHPDFANKTIILYAPTFRDGPGSSRNEFRPEIDFDVLSEALPDNTLFIICPHPVMTTPILGKTYENILEIRDVSTNDMMFISDLLITDYSSVIFEYSLLNKPMIFYCYDYEAYDRDFYLDYSTDLPGEIIYDQDTLIDYISRGIYECDADKIAEFRDAYMGACDGNSTKRIAEVIDNMV